MRYTVNTSGFSMNYIMFGVGRKIMVIIPGLSVKRVTESYMTIERTYGIFAQKYTVYLFDRRENIEQGYNAAQAADDTARAMMALGITNASVFSTPYAFMILVMVSSTR